MNSSRTVLLLLLLPVLPSGCRFFYRTDAPVAGYYYMSPDKDLSAIGRVALFELDNDSSYPAVSADVTEAFFQAFQKKQIFSLTVVRKSDPAWRSLQLDLHSGSRTQNSAFGASSGYTPEQLSAIRETLKCDAVLIGAITEYQPYPHMAIGLRLRLVDLEDGRLLWALEQVWDTADKTTEYRIKNYFRSQMRSGFAPLREQLVTISSLKFIKFVAYEVGETLQ